MSATDLSDGPGNKRPHADPGLQGVWRVADGKRGFPPLYRHGRRVPECDDSRSLVHDDKHCGLAHAGKIRSRLIRRRALIVDLLRSRKHVSSIASILPAPRRAAAIPVAHSRGVGV
jgi:hypothetical protein